MSASLVAVVFSCFAAVAGVFLAPRHSPVVFRILLVWLAVTVVAFLSPTEAVSLFVIGVILAIASMTSEENRVYLFIAAQFALPSSYSYQIPFPGLNFLIDLSYNNLISIVLLGPIFFKAMLSRSPSYLKSVDWFLFAYVIIIGFASLRDLPFTSALREATELFLLIILPYVAISRTLVTTEQFDKAIKVLVIAAAILGFVAVISALRGWNYYTLLPGSPAMHKFFTEYRNGILRVIATMNKPLLALFLATGIVSTIYCLGNKYVSKLWALALFAVLGFGAFATGSRGGWLGAAAVIGCYLLFIKASPRIRNLSISLGLTAVMGLVIAVAFFDVSFNDDFGTFNYRAELLRTSMEQIRERPIFGTHNIQQQERFQHLIQGEGIVDLVNIYLEIALFYGLVGLGTIGAAHAIGVRGGLRALRQVENQTIRSDDAQLRRRQLLLTVSIHFGLLAMVATTSGVSYVWNFGVLMLSLIVAQARSAFALVSAPAAAPAVNNEETLKTNEPMQPEPSGPTYYGARFFKPQD